MSSPAFYRAHTDEGERYLKLGPFDSDGTAQGIYAEINPLHQLRVLDCISTKADIEKNNFMPCLEEDVIAFMGRAVATVLKLGNTP